MRVVLGVSYAGTRYYGWQSQVNGNTVQDKLEKALNEFAGGCGDKRIKTICAGRTDSGVHAINQTVHFDTNLERDSFSWVRATNRYLPNDIAVQWCRFVSNDFHVRQKAISRRYMYIVSASPVRPSLDSNRVGWYWQQLKLDSMLEAASYLTGEHDFSAFRAAECQALSPIKNLSSIDIHQTGRYWIFEFKANAFLQHMIRNLMGTLLAVGAGVKSPEWVKSVLESKQRKLAAATFAADGLYFIGAEYDPCWGLPESGDSHLMIFPFDKNQLESNEC